MNARIKIIEKGKVVKESVLGEMEQTPGDTCKYKDCINIREDGRCNFYMCQFYFNDGTCANYIKRKKEE